MRDIPMEASGPKQQQHVAAAPAATNLCCMRRFSLYGRLPLLQLLQVGCQSQSWAKQVPT